MAVMSIGSRAAARWTNPAWRRWPHFVALWPGFPRALMLASPGHLCCYISLACPRAGQGSGDSIAQVGPRHQRHGPLPTQVALIRAVAQPPLSLLNRTDPHDTIPYGRSLIANGGGLVTKTRQRLAAVTMDDEVRRPIPGRRRRT